MHTLRFLNLLASPLDPLRKSPNAQTAKTLPKGVSLIRAANVNVTAPKREKDPKKRVVITGMGLVSVFGNNLDIYYKKLLDGESGIGPIERFDPSEYPVQFAGQIRGFSSEGYIEMDDGSLSDFHRYCIVPGKKALEHADLGSDKLSKIEKGRAGVLVGTSMGGASMLHEDRERESDYTEIKPYSSRGCLPNSGSALLAIELGLMGPTYSISAACATSNYCFHEAANLIRSGRADLMIAGGADAAVTPIGLGGFTACKALSLRNDDPQTASRPWDRDRDGFVMGEGAGVLVMESLEHAMKRGVRENEILAEYLGGAVSCDAYHITDPRSDGLGVSLSIEKSLKHAGVSPEEVNYINAHATSTPVGDLAESRAIQRIFKNMSEIKVNATKSLIGHSLGAAGGLEAIATIKAIKEGWLHPTINQYNLEPEVLFDTVPNVKQQHEVNVAMSNSFGFGGHNSVVVFSAFKP